LLLSKRNQFSYAARLVASTTPRVQVPRHVARLVMRLVAPLDVDYFASAARPGASARRAARRRLLRLCHASGCFGTSRGSSRRSSSTTSPRAGSSSTTSPMSCVRVPRHIARLVKRLVVDYFTYAARPVASARRMTCRMTHRRLLRLAQARHRLLHLRCACGCFDYAARPGASACRAARHAARRAACRRLLRLHRAFGCLGTSRGSSRRWSSTTLPCASSSLTTSPTPRVRVPRHVMQLVKRLVVDYFTYVARPVARHVTRLIA
jgi:hypothetical protein